MPLANKSFSDIITFTRASTGTFVGSNGLIQTAAANAPRFDFDPVTLLPRGLLIEEQRTNIIKNSGVPYNDGRAAESVTPEGINLYTATGDGNTTAYVGGSGLGNTGFFSVTSGTVYAVSFWAKQLGSDTNIEPRFLTSTGTNVGSAFVSISTTPGRVTALITANANASVQLVFTSVASGQSFSFGGLQVEAGSFRTSYIPTTTASVTRARDIPVVSTVSPWYRTDEGTLFAEVMPQTSSGIRGIASLNDGSATNQIDIRLLSQYRTIVTASGSAQADINSGVGPALNSPAKMALAYKANDFGLSVNGGAPVIDTAGLVPVSINQLDIGDLSTGNLVFNGHIRQIKYFPRRLSNAELQALTTL